MPEKRLQVKPWNMLLFQTHFGGRRSQRFLVESWLTAARCCFANTMPPKAVRKSSEEVVPGGLDRAQIHPKYGEFGGDEEIASYFCWWFFHIFSMDEIPKVKWWALPIPTHWAHWATGGTSPGSSCQSDRRNVGLRGMRQGTSWLYQIAVDSLWKWTVTCWSLWESRPLSPTWRPNFGMWTIDDSHHHAIWPNVNHKVDQNSNRLRNSGTVTAL